MNKAFKTWDLPQETFSEYLDETRKISEKIKNEFPPLINELETEFRNILGVQTLRKNIKLLTARHKMDSQLAGWLLHLIEIVVIR